MVQLEILEADLNDSGVYELVARTEQGEEQSRKVELTEEAIKLSIQVTWPGLLLLHQPGNQVLVLSSVDGP